MPKRKNEQDMFELLKASYEFVKCKEESERLEKKIKIDEEIASEKEIAIDNEKLKYLNDLVFAAGVAFERIAILLPLNTLVNFCRVNKAIRITCHHMSAKFWYCLLISDIIWRMFFIQRDKNNDITLIERDYYNITDPLKPTTLESMKELLKKSFRYKTIDEMTDYDIVESRLFLDNISDLDYLRTQNIQLIEDIENNYNLEELKRINSYLANETHFIKHINKPLLLYIDLVFIWIEEFEGYIFHFIEDDPEFEVTTGNLIEYINERDLDYSYYERLPIANGKEVSLKSKFTRKINKMVEEPRDMRIKFKKDGSMYFKLKFALTTYKLRHSKEEEKEKFSINNLTENINGQTNFKINGFVNNVLHCELDSKEYLISQDELLDYYKNLLETQKFQVFVEDLYERDKIDRRERRNITYKTERLPKTDLHRISLGNCEIDVSFIFFVTFTKENIRKRDYFKSGSDGLNVDGDKFLFDKRSSTAYIESILFNIEYIFLYPQKVSLNQFLVNTSARETLYG
jgi:hypothetical protein